MRRLGGTPVQVDNILVVWVATNPELGKARIVGWYKNASVFNKWQFQVGVNKIHNGDEYGYYACTHRKNAILLPEDKRDFIIPRGEKGMLGTSNVWYADSKLSKVVELKRQVLQNIENH